MNKVNCKNAPITKPMKCGKPIIRVDQRKIDNYNSLFKMLNYSIIDQVSKNLNSKSKRILYP